MATDPYLTRVGQNVRGSALAYDANAEKALQLQNYLALQELQRLGAMGTAGASGISNFMAGLTGAPVAPAHGLPMPVSTVDNGERAVVAPAPSLPSDSLWLQGKLPQFVPQVSTPAPLAGWRGAPYLYGDAAMGAVDMPGVDGECISGSKTLADGRRVPCTQEEMDRGVTILPATTVYPTQPAVVQPEPVISAPSSRGAITPCDLGLCGPTIQNGPYYSNGSRSGIAYPSGGDGSSRTERLGEAYMANRFGGLGSITQYDVAGRQLDTADMRATPAWEAQWRAAMANGVPSAAAAAVADRQMMAATPGSALGYVENLGAGNEQAVDNYRSQLLGAAGFLNDGDIAGRGFGATPGFTTGGVEGFHKDPLTGQPVARIGGTPYTLPTGMASYALAPELARSGVAGQMANAAAGNVNTQKLLTLNNQSRDPVPLAKALLELEKQAQKDPTGTNGGLTPIELAVVKKRAEEFSLAYPQLSYEQIVQMARSGVPTPTAAAK